MFTRAYEELELEVGSLFPVLIFVFHKLYPEPKRAFKLLVPLPFL